MISEKDALELLDEMDDFRRTHQNDIQHPSDWCMRVLEAIVAEHAGFKGRNSWTVALSSNPDSKYSVAVNNDGFLFNG